GGEGGGCGGWPWRPGAPRPRGGGSTPPGDDRWEGRRRRPPLRPRRRAPRRWCARPGSAGPSEGFARSCEGLPSTREAIKGNPHPGMHLKPQGGGAAGGRGPKQLAQRDLREGLGQGPNLSEEVVVRRRDERIGPEHPGNSRFADGAEIGELATDVEVAPRAEHQGGTGRTG